jgi:enterochelin esterase-like enzyme
MNFSLQTSYINSVFLNRTVRVDVLAPVKNQSDMSRELLLIQDGQDLEKMRFSSLLRNNAAAGERFICVGVHAGIDRIQEYGVAGMPDYMQRGSKAGLYTQFIMHEVLPLVKLQTGYSTFTKYHSLGFSLGGLMSIDMGLSHPTLFNSAAAFSGAFWWRSRDIKDGYDDERDRILHAKVRTLKANKIQRFFFQAGKLDEIADRNGNGVIDAIDDTLDLIKELKSAGFSEKQINYLEVEDGAHNVATWGRVIPAYLDWLLQLH